MDQKLFLDTNVFVSFLNQNDSNYEKAVRVFHKAVKNDFEIYASDLVIYEALTVLSLRAGKKIAVGFGKLVFDKKQIGLIETSKQVRKKAWKIFRKTRSKNISFIDCCLAAQALLDKKPKLVTFDKRLAKLCQRQASHRSLYSQ
mgnify:CR=1 FL=1